jgi:signal transduction histidine kinase
MGLLEALRWHAGQVCNQAGIALQTDFPQRDPEISPLAATAVFRVVQEALSNVARHADAHSVKLELHDVEGGYSLSLEDDGGGMPEKAARPGTHGLTGMKYRMLSVGGSLAFGPAKPHGTRVTLKMPHVTTEQRDTTAFA